MKRERSAQGLALAAVLAAVFLAMLALNALTPLLADDFTFSYSFADRDTLHSPYILFRSIATHYFDWSGRVVVKFFAQLFTIPPKGVFNVLNAAMFTLHLWLVATLGLAPKKRLSPAVLLAALGSLWLLTPAFGQVAVWMCGSCNNLWSNVGCFAFLLPWRGLFAAERPRTKAALFFVGGVLAGWLYENTSLGMIAAMAMALAYARWQRRALPAWSLSALAGALAGYVLLIAAPGNRVRTDDSPAAFSAGLWEYAQRFLRALRLLGQYAWPLLLLFGLFFFLLVRCRAAPDVLARPAILFLAGLAAHFAMVLSPVYYLRSSFGPFSLLTGAVCSCLSALEGIEGRRLRAGLAAFSLAAVLFTLPFAFYDAAQYHRLYWQRDAEIRAAVAAGETHVVTWALAPATRWAGAEKLPDIREEQDWISITRALHYGLDELGLSTGFPASLTADSTRPIVCEPLGGLPIGAPPPDP